MQFNVNLKFKHKACILTQLTPATTEKLAFHLPLLPQNQEEETTSCTLHKICPCPHSRDLFCYTPVWVNDLWIACMVHTADIERHYGKYVHI